MTIWLDEQISPFVAEWITGELGIMCKSIYDLALAGADDMPLFLAGREANVVLMTKDRDLADIVRRLGSPPSVVWLRCGNRSNVALTSLLSVTLRRALDLIEAGDPLVEIY